MNLSTVAAFKNIGAKNGLISVEGESLQRLQHVLIVALEDVADVCSRYAIPWFVCGGTLLGAVRHGGFIPWDDDVDICMTRSGYERFKEVFDADMGDRYWLHRPESTDGYGLAFPRVRMKGTVVRGRDDFLIGDECGAYIDIFLVENLPDRGLIRRVHGAVSLVLGLALSCRRFAQYESEYVALAEGDPETEKTFRAKARLGKYFSFRSMDAWCRSWDRWNKHYCNENSKFVGIPVGRKHYFGEMWQRDDLFPTKSMHFEDIEVQVPAHPEAYLLALYGSDYMTPPPPENRETHVVYELDLGETKTDFEAEVANKPEAGEIRAVPRGISQ